ncbi:MAG: hypothetical protein FWG01_04225, partial [Betaproteobacteria bacterium]|nr:hypothetical protein [Betaproteobacteria bacterium]
TAGGTNTISNADSVELHATRAGMSAADGGQNTISDTRQVTITVTGDSNQNNVYGMYAVSGANTIQAGTGSSGLDVEIKATNTATGGIAYGMYTENNGANTITAKNVDINTTAGAGYAYGMLVVGGGSNTINGTADGTINISAISNIGSNGLITSTGTNTIDAASSIVNIFSQTTGTTGYTWGNGIRAYGMGGNTITAKEVNIVMAGAVNSTTNSGHDGLSSYEGAINTIDAGKVSIEVTTGGKANGIYTDGGQNLIGNANTDKVNIAVESTGNVVSGLYAASRGNNTITAGAGDITIEATSAASAYGMRADGASTNQLAGQVVDIKATAGTGTAFGMSAQGSATNQIFADSKVSIEGNGSNAYGMYTVSGTNTIQANTGSSGIEVRVAVEAGQGQKAYAMYATGLNAVNQIIGAAGGGDTITLKGDIFAENGGQNIIRTSGISTIDLNGTISAGGLTLETGVNGHDILILRAENALQFADQYKNWLNEIRQEIIDGHISILSINVALYGNEYVGVTSMPAELAWLDTYFGGLVTVCWTSEPAVSSFAFEGADFMGYGEAEAGIVGMSAVMESDNGLNQAIATAENMEGHQPAVKHESALGDNLIPGIAAVEEVQTLSDSHHDTLAGETGQNHPIFLGDDHVFESLTYISLVDHNETISLDAIHTIQENLASENGRQLYSGTDNDIMVSENGDMPIQYQQGDLSHTVSEGIILDFKLGQDVVDINDLLTALPSGSAVTNLFDGGYFNFDQVIRSEDDSTTIKLNIDTDGKIGEAAAIPLAEITVSGLNLGNDASDYVMEILNQVQSEVRF